MDRRLCWLGVVWCTVALCHIVHCARIAADSNRIEHRRCTSSQDIESHLSYLQLSSAERKLLDQLCLDEGTLDGLQTLSPSLLQYNKVHDGIPEGVACEEYRWCDDQNICSSVCKRGTVQLDAWYKHAIQYQWTLARQQPLTHAQLLGSHNSAITLADGYGNRDKYFEQFFKYISWVSPDPNNTVHLATNNQWLSLTDQMNMGVRGVELDVHWVEGDLRIAHCGGFHSQPLDDLVDVLSLLARIFNKTVNWDAETMGCMPSLSSIPAKDQRTFLDALVEVQAWLADPANAQEFLVLFLDNQDNLAIWHKVRRVLEAIDAAFPASWVLTPAERAAMPGSKWPSVDQLVAMGKRVMIVSRSNYGEAGSRLLFYRDVNAAGWLEFGLKSFAPPNDCFVYHNLDHVPSMGGRLLRLPACELTYGPLNCDFNLAPTRFILDEATLGPVVQCGVNMPSPDRVTPSRMESVIWSWAPGQPPLAVNTTDAAQCAVVTAPDGRWRTEKCGQPHPTACRVVSDGPSRTPGEMVRWVLTVGERGSCPAGSVFDTPRHPKENLALAEALRAAGATEAWLPLQGPDFGPPPPPPDDSTPALERPDQAVQQFF